MPALRASPDKVGCLRHDSRTSEQSAFQTDAEDLALPSALGKKSCKCKADLEFLSGILGVNKMTRYFRSTLALTNATQCTLTDNLFNELSHHPVRLCTFTPFMLHLAPHLHGEEFTLASFKLCLTICFCLFFLDLFLSLKKISLLASELDTPVFVILALKLGLPLLETLFCLCCFHPCWAIDFFSDLLSC